MKRPPVSWFRPLPLALLLVAACGFLALNLVPPAWADVARGSGVAATETRQPGAFEKLEVAGSISVTVRQGTAPSVTVVADDDVLPFVETVVSGDTLKLHLRDGERVRTRHAVQVTVDAVTLSSIKLAGSGDLVLERFSTPALALSLEGAGDARLQSLQTDSLRLGIAGSGDVDAAGRTGELALSIAGSGDADLARMVAKAVQVRIAGSGDAKVHADDSLDVRIAGSGDVDYAGEAREVKRSIAGSGSVRRR
jgi:hypothetical protein